MHTVRTILMAVFLGLLGGLLVAIPGVAQTYTYDGLPVGIGGASSDGANLRPTIKTTTPSSRPVISGVIATGAGTVTIRIGSQTILATADSTGRFTATVPTALAPGEYVVSFNGSVVGTLVVNPAATPSAPQVGTGPTGNDRSLGLAILPATVALAAISVVAFYAVRHSQSQD